MAQDGEWDIRETPASAGDEAGEPGKPEETGSRPVEETVAEPVTEAPQESSPQPSGGEEHPEQEPKRAKKAGRKGLLDLIQKKNTMLQELVKELKSTKESLAIKEDRILRLTAEFENYRKRTRREWELLQKKANADLIGEILGAVDNFDRAFANLGGSDERMQEGLRLIHSGLMDVLGKAGLREIESMKQKFDPLYHEAVGELESEDVEEGFVARVIQRGYLLNDTVIRPARVIVAKRKGPPAAT